MKKIMILGATATQVPLIETAKRLGLHTIVAGIEGDYPGLKVADEVCYVDIRDPQAVLEKAKALEIDGIATCCMDLGVRALGYVCEKMGLTGLTEKAALLSNNKLLMKEAFAAGNVKSPKFYKVSDVQDLKSAWEEIAGPVILKAVDLQASRGIFVCREYQELENAFFEIMKLTRETFCIAEEFLTGIDIGSQAFVYHGDVLFVLPHNDEVYTGSANKPIGHSAPLLADETIHQKVVEESIKAIKAIGLDNCAVNIDLLKTADDVYMIELTGRAGATCLPEMVCEYYGIDYYEMIVKMAVGEDPRPVFESRKEPFTPNASRFVMAEKTGILKEFKDLNTKRDDIVKFDIYVKPGDKVNKFDDGKDRLGQIVVKGKTVEQCFTRLDEITKNLYMVIE